MSSFRSLRSAPCRLGDVLVPLVQHQVGEDDLEMFGFDREEGEDAVERLDVDDVPLRQGLHSHERL